MAIVSKETIKAYGWGLLPSYFISLGITSYFGLDASALGIAAEIGIPFAGTFVPPVIRKIWDHYTNEDGVVSTSGYRSEPFHEKLKRGTAMTTAAVAMALTKSGMDDLANKTITTNNPDDAVDQYDDVFTAEIFLMIAIYLNVMYGHTPAAKDWPRALGKPIIEPLRVLYDLFTCCGICCSDKSRETRELLSQSGITESAWSRCWNAMPSLSTSGISEKFSSCCSWWSSNDQDTSAPSTDTSALPSTNSTLLQPTSNDY